jgi:hypothetical protein
MVTQAPRSLAANGACVPREPMPELPRLLEQITQALEAVRAREVDLDRARRELREAIQAAHEAGASYELIGRLIGVSRQRVAQLAERREPRPS